MKTNELKKGTKVRMRNGYEGFLMDNRKGNLRCVNMTKCPYPEIGDQYAHNIVAALVNGEWVTIEHTPEQLKLKQKCESFGF